MILNKNEYPEKVYISLLNEENLTPFFLNRIKIALQEETTQRDDSMHGSSNLMRPIRFTYEM
jgi:hypothetical protein